ncbi:MAG TPA: peptide chain release factor-like protein [Opitutaceae bacterium]|nr:peptide chain release factor-like protein [Opitutaceae bacterium]
MTGFPLQIEPEIRRRLEGLGVSPGDLEERFVRGAGPGGQKINKTASTVWLRHRPTGVAVRCQAERSQAVNRARAWAELAEKLAVRAQAAEAAAQAAREAERRRTRQKSRAQKARMIEAKQHRAGIKRGRRPGGEEW